MKETLDKLIEAIPPMFRGKMLITMNPVCYDKLCEEMNRKVKSYRGLKIYASEQIPENRIIAHHSSANYHKLL
jgi:hypothetical protein